MARITNPQKSVAMELVLPVDVKRRIKALAEKRNEKASEVARKAIVEYLEKHDPDKRTA
jgi:predicted transcriptional regulator